ARCPPPQRPAARRGVTAQAQLRPAVSSVKASAPATGTGVVLSVCVAPVPSSPYQPSPQQYATPLGVAPQAKPAPAATAAKPASGGPPSVSPPLHAPSPHPIRTTIPHRARLRAAGDRPCIAQPAAPRRSRLPRA